MPPVGRTASENPLPVEAVLPSLASAFVGCAEALLQAEPGAGKTTRVPLFLLDEPWLADRRLLLVQPRRLAARAAAERMAGALGETVGGRVGYRVRGDSRCGPTTQIEVVTDGVFLRLLQADPSLEGVGLVIFDEFHERTVAADLGLALLLEARATLREDEPLRLLLMSATLEGLAVDRVLPEAPLLRSPGRSHPVSVRYGGASRPGQLPLDALVDTVRQALADGDGDVLVFLPGVGEIRRVAAALGPGLGAEVLALHGGLSLARQRAVLAPAAPGERRIVLATAIAETSVTLPGVTAVVDSGLAREARYERDSGMGRLVTRRVSRAGAEQRAGRAGRVAPGRCYRLWSEEQHGRLEAQREPPIRHADLAPLALELLAWGAPAPDQLAWLESPPTAGYGAALALLQRCGAVVGDAAAPRLTAHGRRMLELPVHPRLAHMLLVAAERGTASAACDLAAVLESRPPAELGEDLQRVVAAVSGSAVAATRGWREDCRREAARLRRILGVEPERVAAAAERDGAALGVLVALAYPERVARRLGREQRATFQLAGGRRAQLPGDAPLAGAPWLAIGETSGREGVPEDRVRLAAPLDPAHFDDALAPLVSDESTVSWDDAAQRVVARRERRIGRLLLAEERLPAPSPAQVAPVLAAGLRVAGDEFLADDPALAQWRARVALMRELEPDGWPDLSVAALLEGLEEWLLPWVGDARSLAEIRSLDLRALLSARLPPGGERQLAAQLPETITVPSGHRRPLDYRAGDQPVLAVKLQEMFGCEETPTVAGGRVPVLLHLLSPAGRPLQVTADLASFWRDGYPEVRREMRGRYPKHPWPEDPVTATATATAKRRR